ncbi:MAG: Xaa-Pro peptidase family protein [Gemmatimonadota bacterium]|nr:Xaa-Pro peptidase family protein [Gemmatimonadota bacterium]
MTPSNGAPGADAPVDPAGRRARVRERFEDSAAVAFVVSSIVNVRYLTGFTGSAGTLALFSEGPALLVTDSRYDPQATEEVDDGVEVRIASRSSLAEVREELASRGAVPVAVEGEHLTVAKWEEWREEGGPEAEGVTGWVEDVRAVKAPAEVDAIRRAAEIVDGVLAEVLELVRPGVAERKLAAELVHRVLTAGAERMAFDPVVAFGERSALPHARATARELVPGELALFDFGAVVDGYCSDLTRTVSCGDPGDEMREVYDVVHDAQAAAIEGLRGGMSGREADALAREPIEAAGWGERFGHSLGHGVGLEIHEAPKMSKKSEDSVPAGAVVTVEPGVYIAGRGGVRIEDDVVVRSDGCEVLTSAPKDELLIL